MVNPNIVKAAPRSNPIFKNNGLLYSIWAKGSTSAMSWKKLLKVINDIISNCFPTKAEVEFGIMMTSKKTS